jgi:hypothetical protein
MDNIQKGKEVSMIMPCKLLSDYLTSSGLDHLDVTFLKL